MILLPVIRKPQEYGVGMQTGCELLGLGLGLHDAVRSFRGYISSCDSGVDIRTCCPH